MHAIIIREKAGSTGTKGRVLGSITNLCFSAKSKQKRVNQIRLVATYMEENGWGTDGRIDYAGGDFNFVEALVDHWAKDSDGHYRCGIDSNQRLGSDSVAWRDLMRLKLGWEEVYQPAPTLRGTNQTFWSRNDGIFLITNPGLTSMLQLSAEALERVPMLSGHGAVRLHNKPQHVNRFPNMKIWVAKDPDYKELLQRKLEMNINSEDGAWDQYNVMLLAMWEAPEEVARSSNSSDHLCAEAKLSLALTLYAMIRVGPERYYRVGDSESKKRRARERCAWTTSRTS